MEEAPKPHLLLIHYNPHSHGSFVVKVEEQIKHFSDRYKMTCFIPGPGPFTDKLRSLGVHVRYWTLFEPDDKPRYVFRFLKFLLFLRKQKIACIYMLDHIWWKPAELLAAKLLKVPMLSFIGFYKDKLALEGFLKYSSVIVANSQKTAEVFRENGLSEQTRVIPNFVVPELYCKSDGIRDELGIAKEAKVIGFVGTLHKIKGLEYLLQSFAELSKKDPSLHFLVVGKARDNRYEESLRVLAEKLGISQCHFLGQREDIPAVMNSLDILCVPSLEEPFGYINIEAGAAGVPVIASAVGGIPDIIVDGETGFLIPPKDTEAITEACEKLLGDEALRKAFGKAAQARIVEHFSPEPVLRQWDEVFKTLMRKTN